MITYLLHEHCVYFNKKKLKKESIQIIYKAKKICQDSVVIDFLQNILVYFDY